eukprot:CAMPEP_0194359578 /NCGR_PEP_ID=MMETSP0174-20130528/6835_1 /TAXON_ID=216777 /ORGANISM="Proboscia alata, Strain PI-D3" /LENGTH=65 /DNA_ID=CAMNT_0039130541 /DNA_START=6 /DNA_END=200 /DNA_ORIENTATION=-
MRVWTWSVCALVPLPGTAFRSFQSIGTRFTTARNRFTLHAEPSTPSASVSQVLYREPRPDPATGG